VRCAPAPVRRWTETRGFHKLDGITQDAQVNADIGDLHANLRLSSAFASVSAFRAQLSQSRPVLACKHPTCKSDQTATICAVPASIDQLA
jgi:hypothetical protein